jgi:hypothetical protein
MPHNLSARGFIRRPYGKSRRSLVAFADRVKQPDRCRLGLTGCIRIAVSTSSMAAS